VHIHLAIYGEYVADWYLQQLWREHCVVGGWISVETIKAATAADFRKALREVLKYVSKGDKQPGKRAERAAAIEWAFKNVRRVELGGALRCVPAVTEAEVATAGRKCEVCDGGSSWRWQGIRAPDYVATNGGFGVTRLTDDRDYFDSVRPRERAVAGQLDEVRREEWRRAQLERRPGGAFYGGEPPPWMDDPDEWETIDVPLADRAALRTR
jgi:hypothetical protein